MFEGYEFHSVASLSKNVPVLSCGGLSKNLMIPGWRIGWILIHDRNGAFQREVRTICVIVVITKTHMHSCIHLSVLYSCLVKVASFPGPAKVFRHLQQVFKSRVGLGMRLPCVLPV